MMDLRWRWLFFVIILEILSQTAEGMFIFLIWCYNNDMYRCSLCIFWQWNFSEMCFPVHDRLRLFFGIYDPSLIFRESGRAS